MEVIMSRRICACRWVDMLMGDSSMSAVDVFRDEERCTCLLRIPICRGYDAAICIGQAWNELYAS
eukprot:1147190-Pelagomonas_calceolata.AAC.3